MAEYSKIARGSYVSNGEPQDIYLPFLPEKVTLRNFTAEAGQRSGAVSQAYWDTSLGSGAALANGISTISSDPVYFPTSTLTAGIFVFADALSGSFGAQQQVVSVTKANPVVFTVNNHGYNVGDVVLFEGLYQTLSTGMPQICGMPFLITSVPNGNTFTVNWNTNQSNYTALSSSPYGAFVKQVYSSYLYQPGIYNISNITQAVQAVVSTTSKHNLSLGSRISFRVSSKWGMSNLNGLYATVIQINTSQSFTIDLDTTNFMPFTTNVPVLYVPGLTFPQIVTVGDINTGGGIQEVNSIPIPNGPAIDGAFINNTSYGFTVGSFLCGENGDQMIWEACFYDYSV
jgi:hypothetical protein